MKHIRKVVLGTALVPTLLIAAPGLGYATQLGNAAKSGSMPVASYAADNLLPDASTLKDDIRWAQVELRFRGLYKGSLDGVLGRETKHALEQFQQQNRLHRTASLDAQTWEALTGDSGVAQGSSMPPKVDRAGSATNSLGTSDAGR